MQYYKTLIDLAKILELFNSLEVREWSVTEIYKALEMPPSKVSRMLRSLEGKGFFEKNLETGKYCLGTKFFELGIVYAFHFPLRMIIRPHIEQMAKDLNMTVSCGILRDNKVIVIDRIQNLNVDILTYRIGLSIPIHSTSIGKVLLAYLSEEEQNILLKSVNLKKFTESTIVDKRLIKENSRQIKQCGYATTQGETHIDFNSIAAPIIDGNGNAIAAIQLMDEKSRTSAEKLFQFADYLKGKALFISRQVGYRYHV